MANLSETLKNLSPEKRRLLMEKLREKNAVQISKSAQRSPQIRSTPRNIDLPLSFSQERLWLLEQITQDKTPYNMVGMLRLTGSLQTNFFKQALTEIVRRHEILRSSFSMVNGSLKQIIKPTIETIIEEIDLQELPGAKQLAKVRRLAVKEQNQPFDLTKAPLFRFSLIKLSDTDHVFLIAMHHIVGDGWSFGILMKELSPIYQNYCQGKKETLSELPIQYADFAVWQRNYLQGEILAKELGYWQDKLQNAPAMIPLPTDYSRPKQQNFQGNRHLIVLSSESSDQVKEFCKRQKVTLFTTLLTALKIVLFKWTQQTDLVVGTVIAGRNQEQIENLIGTFINFLALRSQIESNQTAESLTQAISKTVLEGYSHQDCPFEKVVEVLKPNREISNNPLYNVALLVHNFDLDLSFASDVHAQTIPFENGISLLDLRVQAFENKEGLNIEFEYNTDLFKAETIEDLAQAYRETLETLITNPQLKINDFSLPAKLEQQAQEARRRKQKLNLTITSTFTGEPIENGLLYWSKQLNLPIKVEFTAYNQVFQQLLSPESEIRKNEEGINIILVCFADWLRFQTEQPENKLWTQEQKQQIESNVAELIEAIEIAVKQSSVPYLVNICSPAPAVLENEAQAQWYQNLETRLAEALTDISNVYVTTSAERANTYPVGNYYDPESDRIGHIPYTQEYFTALGTSIMRKIYPLKTNPYKVIVLDCDNTLWQGVCGEVGAEGVQIDTPYQTLQTKLVEQQQAGKLLCLCSKNVEEDVWAVFDYHQSMPLQKENLVSWRINWQEKSENLKSLAQELNLGLDSFIFLDDNPVEIAEVQANCPEVLAIQLPQERTKIPEFLQHLWAFDVLKVTAEDQKRTDMYRENIARESLRQESRTFDDFITSLNLVVEIESITDEQMPRASQLTQRTNQFNVTTIRRSEGELKELCELGQLEALTVKVRDRFGDYGLVGLVLFNSDSEAIKTDTLLLSCRVLGRGVEHKMLAKLARIAQSRGVEWVEVPYRTTEKNQPVLDFLTQVGEGYRQQTDEGYLFRLPVEVIANLTLTQGAKPSTTKKSKKQSESHKLAPSQMLARIATELSTVKNIVAEVETWQRKERSSEQQEYVPPRNPVEELLANIWQEVLFLTEIGIHENFFELGGNSLLATQVVSRIQQVFAIELPLSILFEFPTIETLSQQIIVNQTEGEEFNLSDIVAVSRSEILPLSFSQERLWFINQLEGNVAAYNVPVAATVTGILNLEVLEKSLQEIVRRHEVFRTNFIVVDGLPQQKIHPDGTIKMTLVDLENLSAKEQQAQLQSLVKQEAQKPFDLEQDCLGRLKIFRLTPESHVLLFTLHHIISDGWSMGVLIREWSSLYQSFLENKPSSLPELPIQYADFAHWQRNWLQGKLLVNQLNYWKQKLANAPPLLELPHDQPRPLLQSYRGKRINFQLDIDLTQKLKNLSQKQGATLFMTLLTAFTTLLFRYSGQQDIVIGTPIANRNRKEIESLIGFFLNTLVLRFQVEQNSPFIELLKQVRTVCLDAYAHQDVPFEKLVEAIQAERHLNHNPIFQVMFVLQNAPMEKANISGLEFTPLKIDTESSQFDLNLLMEETEQGLIGEWEYNSDLYESTTIEGMITHFSSLLAEIVANPEQTVSELPILTKTERHQLLELWNDTQVDYPQDKCIHHLVEEQVKRTPNAVAVVFEGEKLTYTQLNNRANQLAHYLQELGVQPEVLVGICLERSIEMVVGLLAILKAGGAYVPLDPSYPSERLSYMLDNSQVSILLTQQQLLEQLPEFSGQIICLDSDWNTISQEKETNLNVAMNSENLMYVIYTSGSTGKPKGVMNIHRALVNRLLWMQRAYKLDGSDRVLQKTPFSFDVSVWEFFWTLITGATLVIAKPQGHQDRDYLVSLIMEQQMTTLHFVPSMLQVFVEAEKIAACQSLKRVICSGEALSFDLQERFFERLPHCQLHNLYGPTEAAIDVTYWECKHNHPLQKVPIGRPIANTQLYILDQYLQPVPVGVAGELHLGGDGLARGYLNRPELTQERFIPNPFADQEGERLYKTGDLCRYLPDGNVEYLGRIDFQVKIRGFRIELGEIEASLTQHHGIKEAIVTAKETPQGAKRLVAYVTLNQEQVTVKELRHFLGERLPEYMTPSAFVFLDVMPLNANGKVDRKVLPEPKQDRSSLDVSFVAPRTPREEILATIWSQVLGLEQIGIHDNFFELGGDSIRSIQVMARAKERGLNFSLSQIFQHQTISELANCSQDQFELITTPKTEAFSLINYTDRLKLPEGIKDAYPLTVLQTGMVFHSEFSSESPLYHDVFSYHIKAELNIDQLRVAMEQLVDFHPVLRTSFALTGFSEPLQFVHQKVNIPLSIEDLGHLSSVEQEEAIKAWINREKLQSFDWGCPPLFRFQLHRRSSETFNLTLSFHHSILDGWSIASMMTELFSRYISLIKQETFPSLSQLEISFRDFVALEKLTCESEKCHQYWLNRLSDATFAKLPRLPKSDGTAQKDNLLGVLDVPISSNVSEGLKNLALSAGVPLKSVLLAAHLRVLSILTNQQDVITGLVSNGRPEQTGGEKVLGLFLNTLPLRLSLQGGTWLELVKKTFEAERESLPFRRYPLGNLQKTLGGESLFETTFNFINFHVYQGLQAVSELEFLGGQFFEQTNFVLGANFSLDSISSQVKLVLDYDRNELDESQINAIGGYYLNALESMIINPHEHYETKSLLSEGELQQLLLDWNNTQAEYPQDKCIHQLFEEQVERTPDSVAVVWEEQHLTYKQLNARANQLAHYLRKLGVQPDDLVGICVERSLEMIIGLLAILKAGGAYVPMDPAYPRERLSHLLSDSQVGVVLTQENLLNRLPESEARFICVDRKSELAVVAEQSQANLATKVSPDNLAYVIYTSGSTGKPKGVLIEHRSLVNLIQATIKNYQLTEQDKVLQFASISFDASAEQIYGSLLAGAKLVLRTDEILGGISSFLQKCHDWQLTVLDLPPAYWQQITLELERQQIQLPPLVRLIIIGGEAPSSDAVKTWQKYVGDYPQLINAYGPTETTVTATMCSIKRSTPIDKTVPIGSPLANLQCYILDRFLNPVPIGTAGELHIGGMGLARGYLNRPELTQAKFIANPFSDAENSRLYKTGDLARYLPDGNIEYLGRIDNQVKIRGFRIELGEIEATLDQYPSLKQNVVIIKENKLGDKRLIAYVVPVKDEILIQDLREFLKQKLPEFMIPAAFICLERLPISPNGKVDRRALPDPEQSDINQHQNIIAPRNLLELQLVQLWSEILQVQQVGINSNFFELGGHSLLAVQLMSKIQLDFGQKLPVATLLQNPTIETFAPILFEQSQAQSWSALVEINPSGNKPPLFCVHPAGGNVFCYFNLARYLGTEQPFYGLQSLGLDGQSEPLSSIEDMATYYLQEIKKIQSEGSYHLTGWSFGGLVAFEIAQQLLAQGYQVSFLGLIDTYTPSLIPRENDQEDDATILMDLLGENLNISLNHLQQLPPNEQLIYILEQAKQLKLITADFDLEQAQNLLRVYRINSQVSQLYQPKTYPGHINLFRAKEGQKVESEITLGWEKSVSGTIKTYYVDGKHQTMMDLPYVQDLAQKLKNALEESQE